MADVIVIGGGSGGIPVVARLVESGAEVVLIEAGPDYGALAEGRWPGEILDAAALATSHDWDYTSGPVTGREPWTFERARIMGGCSSHNGAIAAVGHHLDYDSWGLPGWETETLRPLFDRVLDIMRVRAYEQDEAGPFHSRCLEAAASAGWRIASDLCDLDANHSFGLETVNVFEGTRWNTAFAYLDPVRDRQNLTIADECLVDRIETTRHGVTVHALRRGRAHTFDADRVVLAAGVYGTPSILQRSGIGDPVVLGSLGIAVSIDAPLVGTNLHDHPMVNASRDLGEDLARWMQDAAASGFVPEEQTLGKAVSRHAADGVFDLHLFPVCGSTQTSLTNGRALLEVACMTPRSRGTVKITSVDPGVAPAIDHGYLSDPDGHDIGVLRHGLELAEDLLAQPALRSVLVDEPRRDLSDEALRRDVQHYYHPVGTTPMGSDPSTSVCDRFGRLHGDHRILVADASLMPQIPRANTNIPTIVVGERIAELLVTQLNRSDEEIFGRSPHERSEGGMI